MNNEQQIQEALISAEEAKKAVALRDAAIRLKDHPDFKLAVIDGYFKDEAAKMTLLLGDPRMMGSAKESMQADMPGPGAFYRYLNGLIQIGNQAESALEQLDEVLEELRTELVN